MKKPSIRERVKKYFRNRALNKELKKWEAKFKGDKERVEKVTEMCLKVIHTAFPNENDTITIPKILGDMIYSVEETMYDKRGLNHLYFEWASERYMSDFIPEIIEAIKITQKYLIEGNHTEDNRGGHGCGDRYVWYIPHKTKIIQCHTSQNYNVILILDQNDYKTELHIRRFWESVDDAREDDWDIERTKDGFDLKKLLVESQWLTERFSDNLPGNQFIHRPDLKMFKKAINSNSMGSESGRPLFFLDARDPGYVLSYEKVSFDEFDMHTKTDCPVLNYGLLKAVLFDIQSQREYFEEEED